MAWLRRFSLMLMTMLVGTACAPPPPPFEREFLVDSRFSEEDLSAILEASGVWNAEGQANVGRTFMSYAGRYDAHGASFDASVFEDDLHVIYMGDADTLAFLKQANDYSYAGHGTTEDVVLFPEQMRQEVLPNGVRTYETVALHYDLHELGHFIGLGHDPYDPYAIMWKKSYIYSQAPSDSDREALCLLYGC